MTEDVDLGATIAPKSDQLNADDLIAGPRTITVTRVRGTGADDQPIAIYFEGDNGKPYKPCLSMRRAIVQAWGRKSSNYIGKAMALYRDPDVKFGKDTVGGIRISHMSGIDHDMSFPLTERRGTRKPYTIRRLQVQQRAEATIDEARDALEAARDLQALESLWRNKSMAPFREQLQADLERRKAELATTGEPQPETTNETGGYDGV